MKRRVIYKEETSEYPSRQEQMSPEEIKEKLKDYIPLKTMKEKQILTTLKPYKTWVRYINQHTKQFRTGGLLLKVAYPDYIMLVNTNKKLTWSVQLKDNIIFIKDPEIIKKEESEQQREQEIKDKLYNMYKHGQLKRVV